MTLTKRATALIAVLAVTFGALGGALLGQIGLVDATVSDGERTVYKQLATSARILDTRVPVGVPTAAPLGAGETITLGVASIPATATSVQINMTTVDATVDSFITTYAADAAKPDTSSMNPTPGTTLFNTFTVPMSADGKIKIYNNAGSVNVIVDVLGYYEHHTHDDLYYTKYETTTGGLLVLIPGSEPSAASDGDGQVGAASGGGLLTIEADDPDPHVCESTSYTPTRDEWARLDGNISFQSNINDFHLWAYGAYSTDGGTSWTTANPAFSVESSGNTGEDVMLPVDGVVALEAGTTYRFSIQPSIPDHSNDNGAGLEGDEGWCRMVIEYSPRLEGATVAGAES